jgi:hypothetical protein
MALLAIANAADLERPGREFTEKHLAARQRWRLSDPAAA